MTIKGSCQCGSVGFSLENDPMMHFVCHCSDCQKLHGNSFFGYAYSTEDISVTGEVRKYSYEGGSGNLLHIVSCSNCGSTLYTQPDLIEPMIYVPAGMLRSIMSFRQGWSSGHPTRHPVSHQSWRLVNPMNITEPWNASENYLSISTRDSNERSRAGDQGS